MKLHASFKIPVILFFVITGISSYLGAQDSGITKNIVREESWYMQPWAWIVGGVAVLLLLLALFSGGRGKKNGTRTERVIITKTIRTETDTED